MSEFTFVSCACAAAWALCAGSETLLVDPVEGIAAAACARCAGSCTLFVEDTGVAVFELFTRELDRFIPPDTALKTANPPVANAAAPKIF